MENKEVIIDNIKVIKLLTGILIVLVLLTICVAVDSADDTDTISNINESRQMNAVLLKNATFINGTSYVLPENTGTAVTDGKIYTDKNTVTITSKPSCGCRNVYRWHTRTFLDYCPNCRHYDCLTNKHKWGARYEQEISCKICDSDFCGVCGKEKYSWSHVYLKKA